jgi:hypothetical protein
MEVYLDGNNEIDRVDGSGIFEDFGKRPRGRAGSRTRRTSRAKPESSSTGCG